MTVLKINRFFKKKKKIAKHCQRRKRENSKKRPYKNAPSEKRADPGERFSLYTLMLPMSPLSHNCKFIPPNGLNLVYQIEGNLLPK